MSRRILMAVPLLLIGGLITRTGAVQLDSASVPTGPGVWVGAAVGDFTPPPFGSRPGGKADPADCIAGTPLEAVYNGHRDFAFEEPYIDQQNLGHYAPGDPYVDCAKTGRWEGNLIGGGTNNPRFYDFVPQGDGVTARALAVRNAAGHTAVVEVLDQEGVFNVYQERIRNEAAAELAGQGHADVTASDMFISATHDESAPDSLGLGGVTPLTSGTNDFFVDYMIDVSAQAIVEAVEVEQPAHLRYAQAIEPADLRQCWSSYPYVDDQLMPVLQAVADGGGGVIATLASVSQHAETLGFNADPTESGWLSADWPHFFRAELETRYPGSVAIEMAGSVGSVETPEVFSEAVSRVPQQYVDESHPAGCSTVFTAPSGDPAPLAPGYSSETAALGTQLADAVAGAIDTSATWSASDTIWGERAQVCLPLDNQLFAAAGVAGVFDQRPAYLAGCRVEVPAAPNGTTAGRKALTEVAAFRIGDGEFAAVPGEAFPYTYLGGFLGPEDMPYPQYAPTPMLMPHMHTPYRFFDGLAEDMVGYIFPRGDAVGIPGEHPVNNQLGTSDTDRFGCGHSDDSEAASGRSGDVIGSALVALLDENGGAATSPEDIEQGRYVMSDGTLSRDPLGTPGSLGCSTSTNFVPDGTALAVWVAPSGASGPGSVVTPAAWLDLSGRAQQAPDRNTRGWVDAQGTRHWLDVFPDIAGAPSQVTP